MAKTHHHYLKITRWYYTTEAKLLSLWSDLLYVVERICEFLLGWEK